MNIRRGEAGQTLVMVVLCMTAILAFAGLAADVGTLFHDKRRLQTAADSAAIAGATELLYGDAAAAAQTDATKNGFTNGATGTTIVVNNPPATGPHAGNVNYVEVIATQTEHTTFMNLFAFDPVTVSARAVAYPGLGSSQGDIYALGGGVTDITLNGSDSISVLGAIYSDGDISMNGSTSITAKFVGATGTASGNITPAPVTGMAPVSDPLAYLAAPSTAGACQSTTKQPLQPGVYCTALSGNNTLSAGTYILKGGVNMTGTAALTGTGVTLYLTNNSSITLKGNATINLSAPTSGTYNDIVIFQDRSDSASAQFTGSSSLTLNGIVYMPDSSVTFSGGSGTPLPATLIVQSLLLNGSIDLAGAPVGAGYPIKSATLAE